jgi:hypothetical protein
MLPRHFSHGDVEGTTVKVNLHDENSYVHLVTLLA